MTGVLDSLGKAARHNYILIAECRGMGQPCGRRSSFLPGDLAEIYGAGRDPHRLRFHGAQGFRQPQHRQRAQKTAQIERKGSGRRHALGLARPRLPVHVNVTRSPVTTGRSPAREGP